MDQIIPLALSYDDVLLVPQYSKVDNRSKVDLTTQISPNVKLNIPLISINMSDVTEERMAIALGKLGGIGFIHRFNTPNEQADMVNKVVKKGVTVGAAIGIRDRYLDRAKILAKAGAIIITIDIAHGAMKRCIDATKMLKQTFGNDVDIVSGVVASYDGAKRLFEAGADSVRVGVGPGTICTTRSQTGVGVPQISALLDCLRAVKSTNKTILCDGGTKNSGDIVKGLATGASGVIVGSQFAGTIESPGKIIKIKGKNMKAYNASTSYKEKKNHFKKIKANKNYINHIEGIESHVEFKGSLKDVIIRMEANLRAGYSYCGASNLQELWKNAKFVRLTHAGLRESSAHDVIVVKD